MKYVRCVLLVLLAGCNAAIAPAAVLPQRQTFMSPLVAPSAVFLDSTTILPTATSIPRWAEYESALAHEFLPEGIKGVCEWDILGRSEQEVFVWAVCQGNSPISGPMRMSAPAVIHLATDNHIQGVNAPRDGTLYSQDVKALFPLELQEQIFAHRMTPDLEEHMQIRITRPDTPPLIVLSGTPLP